MHAQIFQDLFQKGGPVMWPIAVFGLVALTIIIERAIYFYMTGVDYKSFRDLLVDKLCRIEATQVNVNKALADFQKETRKGILTIFRAWVHYTKWNRSPYIKTAALYVKNISKGHKSRDEALRRFGSEEIERMERYFKALSAIAHIAPLLGLLGTVTGIIQAFSVISQMGGQVDVSALAAGIWEAMVTTASGLSVAIPAQLAFLYFEKLVSRRVNRMHYIITYFNEMLFDDGCEEKPESMDGDYSDDVNIADERVKEVV